MRKQLLTMMIAAGLCSACQAGGPDGLAAEFAKAADAGDATALRALVDLAGSPSDIHFALLNTIDECAGSNTCTATVGPITPDWETQTKQVLDHEGASFPVAPEGLITLQVKDAEGKDSGSMDVPYAKVGDAYRLVAAKYTPEKLVELRARTAQSVVDDVVARKSEELGEDWKAGATDLGADGGEPGKAFAAHVQAAAQGVQSEDPDLVAKHTGDRGAIIFGAENYEKKPIPMDVRKAKLRAQAPRMLVEAKVLGGWQRDDLALIAYEGRNGAGNIERGVAMMERRGDAWSHESSRNVEFPAN